MNGKKGWKLGLMGWVLALSTWAQSGNEWRMTADSLILYAGQTCRYTVDTPEGEGVVSTLLSVPALLEKLSQDSTIAYRHRLSTQRLSTFYSGRFPSTRLRTVHTGLPVHGSPPSHSV